MFQYFLRSKDLPFVFLGSLLLSLVAYPTLYETYTTLPFEGTYGSDAFHYYQSAYSAAFLGADCTADLAPLHVCYYSNILYFFQNAKFIALIISFIIIYSFTSWLIYFTTGRLIKFLSINQNVTFSNSYRFYLLLLLYNPIIAWTLLRGIKETFVFLCFSLWFYGVVKCLEGRYVVAFMFVVLSSVFSEYLKPLGSIFIFFPFILFILFRFIERSFYRKLLVISCGLVLFMFFLVVFNSYITQVSAHQDIYLNQSSGSVNIISYLSAPLRFILGPGVIGPFRQLLYGDVFIVSTKVADWLIFIGGIIWYGSIFKVLFGKFGVFFNFNKNLFYVLFLVSLVGLFYVGVYSFAYLGQADTRHRAVVYVALAPAMAIIMSVRTIAKRKNGRGYE